MNFCRLLFLTIVFVSVFGCATSHDIVDPNAGHNTVSISTTQTGIILGSGDECVFTEVGIDEATPLAIVGATIVPKLVDQGVSAIADWLETKRQERESKLSAVSSGRGASELYGIDGQPNFDCVMVYRGTRGRPSLTDEKWTKEVLGMLGLSAPPDLFFELSVIYSFSHTAFRLSPRSLEYRRSAAEISGGRKDVILIGIFDGVFGNQPPATGRGFGSFQISLPALNEGTFLSGQELSGISSGWMRLPPVPPKGDNGVLVSTVPFSLLITVAEIEPGNDLMLGILGAMSTAVAESRDDLTQQIVDEVMRRLKLDSTETKDGAQEQ